MLDTRGFRRKLSRIDKRQPSAMRAVLEVAGRMVQTEARDSIKNGPKSGRTYDTEFYTDSQGRLRKSFPRVPHQASSAGQAPADDTGELASSIFTELRRNLLRPSVFVGTDLDYGKFLEFGTKNMEARPWLNRAFKKMRPKILTLIEVEFRRANRK